MTKRVYIGVGHGGDDPGACANGWQEEDLALDVSLSCYEYLNSNGVQTYISRKTDESDSVNEKANEANSYDVDLVVDIHFNAGGGDGAEILHSIHGGTGKTMGQNILNELVSIGQNSRGLKTKTGSDGQDYFAMIRDTHAPSNIVECAFIDNKTDMSIADTLDDRKRLGVAIAKGIIKTLGISNSEPSTPPPSNSSSNEKAPIPTLKDGSQGSEVKKLQGYVGTSADGIFGSNTKQAVMNWQRASNLVVDGIYGSASQKEMQKQIDSGSVKKGTSLPIPTPTLKKGSQGQEVVELQNILLIPNDGIFGSQTESSLKSWQKKYMSSNEADGIYGSKTEAKMKEIY